MNEVLRKAVIDWITENPRESADLVDSIRLKPKVREDRSNPSCGNCRWWGTALPEKGNCHFCTSLKIPTASSFRCQHIVEKDLP
jgi:hypothetical protein